MDLLIKNCRILNLRPPATAGGDVLIRDGVIRSAGGDVSDPESKNVKTIDAAGRLLIPGNVCGHNHFYSALARGMTAKLDPIYDFVTVLRNLWWKLDRSLDEETLALSGMVGCIEAIRAGTTAVVDHNASPSFIKGSLSLLGEGFRKTGLRGMLCYEVTDRGGDRERDEGVEENVSFIKGESGLLRGAVGAHAPFTLSDRTLSMLREAVRETSRGIHMHVSEDRYDLSYSHAEYGLAPVERLDKFGLLDAKSIIVHGVHLLEKEVRLLEERDCFLVHNPRSNMNNAVGYNPRLLSFKNLALGTDGIGSDMFEEMKIGYFKSRDGGVDAGPDDFLSILWNGNRLLERYFDAKFGRIEPGYEADLVLLDYPRPTPLYGRNAAGHFIYGMGSSAVRTVIVGGRVVYENGSFPFDVDDLYEKARKCAPDLWKRAERAEG